MALDFCPKTWTCPLCVRLTELPKLVYLQGMNATDLSPQIAGVPPPDQDKALGLVFGHFEPAERRRQIDEALYADRGHIAKLDGLVAAWRDGRLVGAMFSQVQPGRIAAVWLPRLVAGEPEATAVSLLAANWEYLGRQHVVLAHVLLEKVGPSDETLLRQGEFDHMADLLYLVSLSGDFPASSPAAPLDLEPYREANHERLARIVESTYEATLDCPRLDGVRKTEDVLAGYRSAGAFDPGWWLIVRHADRDVGCLLLADQPRHDSMELVYMGLIREARGQGWGRLLARHAQWLAHQAGRTRLVLAVDAINTPAIRTYTAVGFEAWQQRRMYVRALD
jgi:ribosomal protein S18 acetylase RimI-like enzyme